MNLLPRPDPGLPASLRESGGWDSSRRGKEQGVRWERNISGLPALPATIFAWKRGALGWFCAVFQET